MNNKIRKKHMVIISGGQTGVDRAALDVALQLQISCGGWCPKGRKAEDGPIDKIYPLHETNTNNYLQRTKLNVLDSDGTLILAWGEPQGGTLATVSFAKELGKPYLLVNMQKSPDLEVTLVVDWICEQKIKVLNVAGPRGSFGKFVYKEAYNFLKLVLQELLARKVGQQK